MYKEEGVRGFMKGNGINVVRVCRIPFTAHEVEKLMEIKILPYSALQFTVSCLEQLTESELMDSVVWGLQVVTEIMVWSGSTINTAKIDGWSGSWHRSCL
jgi:hypothetical protein